MALLGIELFGKPQITHDGRPLTFRTRKALALLVYLVVEGGEHSRAKLATFFWPESDPGASRATLRSTLRYLRRPLEHASGAEVIPHLRVTREALSFNFDSDYELDLDLLKAAARTSGDDRLAHLESLQQAVAIYRGEFLEGFSLSDAPGFDDWVAFQQEHWHLRLSEIFDRLSQAQAWAGETSDAIETTARWVAFQPLKEVAYRRLMRLHLAAGDRAAALQTYETCRQTLSDELDVEPSPETGALAQQIRDAPQQAGAKLQKGGASTEISAGEASVSEIQWNFPVPFVGRRHQHTRLVEAYFRSVTDRSQAVLIEGEAGIGKTRLAQEFLGSVAAQGAETLQGRAFEAGGRLPYQPVVDALRPMVSHLSGSLSRTWLGELARILPEVNDLVPDLPAPTTDENLGRSRLFEAVARLGMEISERIPFILFVDDLQWADVATLDLLSYLARRWSEQEARMMFLGAIRAEALHRAASSDLLVDWLRDLEREPGLVRLELEMLGQAEITHFVKRSLHHRELPEKLEEFSKWLFRETRGQPFFLTETIKALLEDEILVARPDTSGQTTIGFSPGLGKSLSWGEADPLEGSVPPGVQDVVRDRLSRLSPEAFDLLAAGAVLGQDFDFRNLCHVADLPKGKALRLLDSLLGTRLLAESKQADRPYTFSHDKIRDVVYTEAGDARRQLFHERALETLQDRGAPSAQLAHHAHGAGRPGAAFRHSLHAGEDAMDLFAVRDALFHFERAHRVLLDNRHMGEAVDGGQRRHLYERLGRAYELVNDWDSAQDVYDEMLAYARETERPEMEVTALNRLATLNLLWKMDSEAALSIVEEARTVAEASDDRQGLAEAEWNACLSKFYTFQRPVALEHGERAIALARESGDRELIAKCLNASGYAASGVNLWQKVEDYGREARALYAEEGNRALEADSLLLVAFARINVGQTAAGVAGARQALHICREIENEWGEANSRNHLAAGLLDRGAYAEAIDVIGGLFQLEQVRDTPQQMAGFTVRGMCHRALCDFQQALADHLRAEELLHELGSPGMTRVLSAHLCADYASLGRWEKAYEQAQIAMQTKDFAWYYAGFHYWSVTEALLRGAGETTAQGDVVRLEEAVGHSPRYRIVVERSKAALDRWRNDYEGAVAHFEAALRVAEKLSLPGEQWAVLCELAELEEKQGNREGAVAHRRHAHEIAERIAEDFDDSDLREEFLGRTAASKAVDPPE